MKKKRYDWGFVVRCGIYLLLVAMLVWIFASWLNIISHNTTDYDYWKFNFFTLFN